MKRITEKYLVETAAERFIVHDRHDNEKKRLLEALGKDKATIDTIMGNDSLTAERCNGCMFRLTDGIEIRGKFYCDSCIKEMAALL